MFTYDLSTAIGKTRLRIGDTMDGSGPRPDGRNFDDNEISALLTAEGNHVGRATALACEVLAAEWAAFAQDVRTGPIDEHRKQAEAFEKRADALRQQHGFTTDVGGFSVPMKAG